MKTFKFTVLVAAIAFILATAGVGLLNPPLHKVVKIDSANLVIKEQNLDTNTKENKIVWNQWHSDLANKLLKDKGAPQGEALGTVNIIQFNVDNKRNISGIKIVTEPDKYSKIARAHYIEYLNNLNGAKILEFPANSNRKVVTVITPIETSTTEKYSTPADYSDDETIKR